jgi:hypothetical protein
LFSCDEMPDNTELRDKRRLLSFILLTMCQLV